MTLPDVTILDVGHGNCAVLVDEHGVVVIDAASGPTLLQFLCDRGLSEVDTVLISHADEDHLSGILALLTDPGFKVHKIYFNSEPLRNTEVFKDFLCAVGESRKNFRTEVHVQLTTTCTKNFDRGEIRIEILAPVPEIAGSGAGGRDLQGRRMTPNTMSAVIRIVRGDTGEILFTGDIDSIGLDNLLKEFPKPHAHVLVFPHHGGLPGSADAYEFALKLCRAVNPNVVVFSIGRGKHNTPRPEVIRGVRMASPHAHIACTQLSERCANTLPNTAPAHLSDLPSRGRATNACCAGTINLKLKNLLPICTPPFLIHKNFIEKEATNALCLLDSGNS